MSCVAAYMSFRKDGTDDAPKFGPETATSTFRYATAFSFNSDAFSSAHSVEPINPCSSASQLQRMMERRGFQPDFDSWPKPRASSSIAVVPLLGSTAPNTQASR